MQVRLETLIYRLRLHNADSVSMLRYNFFLNSLSIPMMAYKDNLSEFKGRPPGFIVMAIG